ncbi:hypothetical protein V496_08407 [Pseudogymnoascus sp. VKM F-4515 (FW-2607)]|nr:hypothetical protein V496_08407 [Pseudogymnoascus sp. VKM F-4515 (FW-2607)]
MLTTEAFDTANIVDVITDLSLKGGTTLMSSLAFGSSKYLRGLPHLTNKSIAAGRAGLSTSAAITIGQR